MTCSCPTQCLNAKELGRLLLEGVLSAKLLTHGCGLCIACLSSLTFSLKRVRLSSSFSASRNCDASVWGSMSTNNTSYPRKAKGIGSGVCRLATSPACVAASDDQGFRDITPWSAASDDQGFRDITPRSPLGSWHRYPPLLPAPTAR